MAVTLFYSYMRLIIDFKEKIRGFWTIRRVGTFVLWAMLYAPGIPPSASGQATSSALVVKAVAEVESRTAQDGHVAVRLVPADRVVPGDLVIYTLEIRNPSRSAVREPIVIYAVPTHMRYVADSATGPGAEVRYSADDGHVFDRPENLRINDADGHSRVAKADEYTHIRWKLKNTLKAKSVAFARFRAIVN
jgi:uncharacterized repeat protein (TIGR01451 family)